MKKKIYSVFTLMFVMLACVFASACGNKYKNMEFKVYYAFTENADQWYDGTDGISLNYDKEEKAEGEENSSLVFDSGVATLYVRIEISNVKSKHVDSITVNSSSVSGLDFSSKRVKEGEVFEMKITGNVNAALKLYENNSGKTSELPFVVSRTLESIEADMSIKPAMLTTGTLSLLKLNNLSYHPINQTNQIGVTYSVDGIGYYDSNAVYSQVKNAEAAKNFVKIENGILKVVDASFFNSTAYVVRVKATSLFHDGSKDAEDVISAVFDVYVVESNLSAPVVNFVDDLDANNSGLISQINLYENGGEKYSKSTVIIDSSKLLQDSIYGNGVYSIDGKVNYSVGLYVLNSNGNYEKYDFEGGKHQEGINGLVAVKDDDEKIYTFSIADRTNFSNQIKFVYEIEGFDFSSSQKPEIKKQITVSKSVLPTCVTVNNTLDLNTQSGIQYANVYGTSQSSYKGLALKLDANPNDNANREIELEYDATKLVITNGKTALASNKIVTGSTIYVKFKDGVTDSQSLKIKTLKSPNYYNEVKITNADYIVANYVLTKVVTANSFAFVLDKNANSEVTNIITDANNESNIYIKVNYSGVNLERSSIKLVSSDDDVLFANDSTEILLNDSLVNLEKTVTGDSERYDVYSIPMKKTDGAASAEITMIAGEGLLKKSATVSSVSLMNEESKINVSGKSSNVKNFTSAQVDNGAFNFAISKSDYAEFQVKDGEGKIDTIAKIELKNSEVAGEDFSSSAISYNIISNSVFVATGKIGGKTQILDLKVFYYKKNANDVIELTFKSLKVQIAVYDAIGNIIAQTSKDTIGYVNSYYTDISSTEITFNSYTSNYGTPANSVVFAGNGENISINQASQVQVEIANFFTVKNSGAVSIRFVSGNTEIDLLGDKNNTIITLNSTDYLSGKIIVALDKTVGELNNITLTIRALRFGAISNVVANSTIKVAKVEQATKITISGESFVPITDSSSEIQMSFMRVKDGEYAEDEFNATINFESTSADSNTLRFDDISSALTHMLYQYEIENGQIVDCERIQDDYLNITYQDGVVKIRARKRTDSGGLFKLVLATKDSYNNDAKDPALNSVNEEDFDKTCSITIRVEDGRIGSEYAIRDEADLELINYNLNSNFVLGKNLDMSTHNLKPLGTSGSQASKFMGSLNGYYITPGQEGQTLTNPYSITFKVSETIQSDNYGMLAGLFGILGDKAVIKNLKLNVTYANSLESDLTNGIKVGALAGVNEGTIQNVEVNISNKSAEEIEVNSSSAAIDFGGIVGLNKKTIENSKVECSNEIIINVITNQTHNIGLIAGTNNEGATISGAYQGKSSLNNFIFDVVANMKVKNNSTLLNSTCNVGSVAGFNNGTIYNLLVGGKIALESKENNNMENWLGGIVGQSQNVGNTIDTVVAMSLNLAAKSSKVNVGGIVGKATDTIVDNVKFVSVVTENLIDEDVVGQITGDNIVGGIAAQTKDGTITYASVESFVDTIIEGEQEKTFFTLNGGTTIAGLVPSSTGTSIANSFVKGNIYSTGTIYLTANESVDGSYFIGKVENNAGANSTYTSNATYEIVNGGGININSYIEGTTIDANNSVWTNIYVDNGAEYAGERYVKATKFESGKTYVGFKLDEWITYAKGLIDGATWTDGVDEDGVNYSVSGVWKLKENYNVITINGINFFFPFLLRDTEALQIVEPQDISAEINQKYNEEINSVYVPKFDISSLDIAETVIVNFFKGAGEEANAYNLINTNGEENPNGLIDVEILPKDAQGGYAYTIVAGGSYAYINSKHQIVFINDVSGANPIIVKIYSVFNPEVYVYVCVYSQCLTTELKLSSSSIYLVNQQNFKYEINTYTGQNNKIISLVAENIKDENKYSSIFEAKNVAQYLKVVATSDKKEKSLLEVGTSAYNNMTLKIKEGADVSENYNEIITFSLYLDSTYFANANYVTEDVLVGEVKLLVRLYNSATSINVAGANEEKTTADDISFDVYLTTDFVNESEFEDTDSIVEKTTIEDGDIVLAERDDHDGIKISLDIVEGQEEKTKLINSVNQKRIAEGLYPITEFAELFNVQIVSKLYTSADDKVIGYVYKILLELENKHEYRYITNNIKFNITISSISNPDVNNVGDEMEILLKPTSVTTARIENYKVTSLNVNTDYTDIVTNNDVQTSIIEPGSLGNLMMIYLEPTYSNVVSAKISTSSLKIPSLANKEVRLKFTQLVLDYRKNPDGVFTTIYGREVNSQVGDTLELKLISEIDANGNESYNGIVLIYIQLVDRFAGVEDTFTITLDVETNNGQKIERTKELLTTYLPGAELTYNEDRKLGDGYIIQRGTSNNEVTLKLYGYQFNSNPRITFEWFLPSGSTLKSINPGKIYDDSNDNNILDEGEESYLIGDYISYYLLKDYSEVVYNKADNSYSITLKLNVAEDIPAAFKLGATLTLTTKDGELIESYDEFNNLIFYPTDYIINSAQVTDLVDGKKNVAIGKTTPVEFMFTTDNLVSDKSSEIFGKLIEWATVDGSVDVEKLGKLFVYYQNGGNITFADAHQEFDFNIINNNKISITGVSKFSNVISFSAWYGYKQCANGIYELNFGQNATDKNTQTIDAMFTLDVFAIDRDKEIIVYGADEIFNSTTGQWNLVEGVNYVLMNDIELENVVPITTAIGGFDGNNRTISIKSFAVNPSSTDFGLFANIGTYTIKDEITGKETIYQTTLKNVIVDYSKFNGSLALNNNSTVNFGGLVGTNNGGIIYNCDVINLSSNDVALDFVVANKAVVTFGGIVGVNNGVITNSRVGHDEYTRITATQTTESTTVKRVGGLTFSIFNKEVDGDENNNQFEIVAGAFVGKNSGTISTSFVANTNLYNYSTHEQTNKTAGFVGENTGKISYSYSQADEDTITIANPYATGYKIDNKGNGIVAGFVYTNSGNINNSYANLELQTKSAYIAGFVYNNTGTISESYAATKMNSGINDNIAEQPFVGVDNAGTLLSNGVLENTYYLMRSNVDNPYQQGGKDIAQGLNLENFQNSEYLIGFAFVLSNSKVEREQGIWSYYSINNKKRALPELMNANIISSSYRFVVETEDGVELKNAVSYAEGSANNPYIISNVEDYNEVFAENNSTSQVGYIRFVNDINFNNDEKAIKTRANYTLGSSISSTTTSVEGNGMTIGGIYLDVGQAIVNEIGLFANIKNAYIKNLNLEFANPTTDGQFSTTTVKYSGGLAGKIENSVIINIKLSGQGTTLTGKNFVGGVAGMITGSSLIYGIETNLNVKASATESYLYYSEKDYNALNMKLTTFMNYAEYVEKLSYAGGIAGVVDLTKKSNVDYNMQFIDVRGDQMGAKTFDGKKEANILAEYAGGIAGYAGRQTEGFKLRYFAGKQEIIQGDTAAGGLFGVSLGKLTASQVAAEEDTQYKYDTEMGKYIIALETDPTSVLGNSDIGNKTLIESYKHAGGLVGLGLNSTIRASYAKAGIKSGEQIGGLIGTSVASIVTYSYAIPYINDYDGMKNVGGLFGSAYGISSKSPQRNGAIVEYEKLLKYKGVANQSTDIQFTYSTLVMDNANLKKFENVNMDYIAADYMDKDGGDTKYLQSNNTPNLAYVYAGTVNYPDLVQDSSVVQNQTAETSKSAEMELFRLFEVGNPAQTVAFQEVFSGWSLMKYWTLDEEKYFPLLNNESVDNFIDIDDGDDIDQIIANPEGKFRVVDDIELDAKQANWIVSGQFEGVLIGEIEGDSRRPTIVIKGLTPNTDNETSGFFQKTRNATISNLTFEWTCGNDFSGINMSNVSSLTMVSGLTCEDENSLISNVEVRVSCNADKEGYLINDTKPIAGFGGIVGKSTNTNILGCNFVGQVKATMESTSEGVYVGGIVGYAKTEIEPKEDEDVTEEDEILKRNSNTAVINGSNIGARGETFENITYPKTSFDLTIKDGCEVYVGGIIGKAENVAVASTSVGHVTYDTDYQFIDININLEGVGKNVYVGGTAGYAENGMISRCETLTNMTIVGSTSYDEDVDGNTVAPTLKIGGLAGEYNLSAASLTSGIQNCNVNANIKTTREVEGTTKLLRASDESGEHKAHVMISTGVASLTDNATMKQCLFVGQINTEGSDIKILYAAGAVANVAASDNFVVDLEEVITNAVLIVGTSSTTQIYAGGLIGKTANVQISYSASWGRIVPITAGSATDIADSATDIYVGGLVGKVENKISVNNSYTISSIIADSIAPKAISKLTIGALIGAIPENATSGTSGNVNITNTYYSSDYALFADENYVDNNTNFIGNNLSAQTLLNNDVWKKDLSTENNIANSLWTTRKVNSSTRLPYLSSLEGALYNYGVLDKTYDYVEGSAMRPMEVDNSSSSYSFVSEYNGKDEFTYYLLMKGNSDYIPQFNNSLKGLLIGQYLNYENTFTLNSLNSLNMGSAGYYSPIIPHIAKHSAVSNLNVIVSNVTVLQTTGVIAGRNEGVIFNSSVQGNGITVEGSGDLGLIAGRNEGLVSFCYSSAEIISTGVDTSGIVYMNAGKMMSNYFTGYIEAVDGGVFTAGVIGEFDGSNYYVYNNYMAGVIKGGTGHNNFSATAIADVLGSNNFIDKFSDLDYCSTYSNKTTEEKEKSPIKSVSTSALMTKGDLKGVWYYAATNTVTKAGEYKVELNTDQADSNNSFGYNYNYPVYRFNRKIEDGSEFIVDDKQNQLPTGTGDVIGDSLVARYNYLVDSNKVNDPILGENNACKAYKEALKIPHLGVLASIQSLMGKDKGLNYVVIYDLDGKYKDASAVGDVSSNYNWTAIGNENVEGFINNSENGFNGVFITNRNYAFNNSENKICTITNLSKNGLFTNITNAYFGDIILGSFSELENSGALGATISGNGGVATVEEGATETTDTVTVNNVAFKLGSTITGKPLEGVNYLGGLFGEVKGNLNIQKLTTAYDSAIAAASEPEGAGTAQLKSVALTLGNENQTVGLIAGKSSGTITLAKDMGSTYYAYFVGGNIVGGIVGEMDGGTIDAKENIISIVSNCEDTNGYINMLGGVAGKVSADSNINNAVVELCGPNTGAIQFNANAFGGVAGHVYVSNGDLTISLCTIKTNGTTEVAFYGNSAENRYYGMITAKQESNVKVSDTFKLEIEKITISPGGNTTGSTKFDENAEDCGVGTCVGWQKGNLTMSSTGIQEGKTFEIVVNGVPNVGGISGYYAGGTIDFDKEVETNTIKLQGTTNVGGLFGYCNADITTGLFTAAEKNLLDTGFATVYVGDIEGYENADVAYSNFGGLFGRWVGSNISTGEGGTESVCAITNNNQIEILTAKDKTISNIGGVAGKLITSNIEDLTNNGSIKINETSLVLEEKIDSSKDCETYTAKTINVGGVLGLVEGSSSMATPAAEDDAEEGEGSEEETPTSSAILKNLINIANVQGYQNVGGLVGRMSGDIKLINNESISVVKPETGTEGGETDTEVEIKLVYDTSDGTIKNATGEEITISKERHGEIYGVVNVGGVVGLATNGATIEQVYSTANIYGNTNVGGLVGLAENATLKNNLIEATFNKSGEGTEAKITQDGGIVKGIYYNHVYKKDEKQLKNSFIPTSVGGLVGTTSNSALDNNILQGVAVTSSKEGTVGVGDVISTISNYMSTVNVGSGNKSNLLDFTGANIYDLKTKTLEYNSILSGFGGFAGTYYNDDTKTANNNFMIAIDINAQLGVNVGTYVGVYKHEETAGLSLPTINLYEKTLYFDDGKLTTDTTKTKVDRKNINIDGAYNIGGVVGFIDGVSITPKEAQSIALTNAALPGSATINLQSRVSGMYVGGLVGKTNANQISGLNILSGQNVNILLYTNNSYYIGGLIGRAEVKGESLVDGSIGSWILNNNGTTEDGSDDYYQKTVVDDDKIIASGHDDKINFGGLIGLLKVAKGTNDKLVTVKGNHTYPFTINTIENSDYADGQSSYNKSEETNGVIELYAQAYYVNQNKFAIDSAKVKTYQAPFDSDGWAKEYSAVKTIQRCIPQDGTWDSIGVIFDAECIKSVKVESGKIACTEYEEESNISKFYYTDGIARMFYDENGDPVKDSGNIEKVLNLYGYYDFETDEDDGCKYYVNFNDERCGLLTEKYTKYKCKEFTIGSNTKSKPGVFKPSGKDFYVIKDTIFEKPISSASIFAITGVIKQPEGEEKGNTEPEEPSVWELIGGFALIVLGIVFAKYTGGLSLKAVKYGVAMLMTSAMIAYGASEVLSYYADLAVSREMSKNNAQNHYIQTYNQSAGFLSSIYDREIYFENGIVQSTADDMVTIGSETFRPLSFKKPSDYHSSRLKLVQLTEKPRDESYNVDPKGETCYKSLEEVAISGSVTVKNTVDGTTVSIDINYANYEGKWWGVFNKYIFHEGMYWINVAAMKVTKTPTDVFFTPDSSDWLYHKDGGKNYVDGTCEYNEEAKEYEYEFKAETGNYVTSATESVYTIDYGNGLTYALDKRGVAERDVNFEYAENQNVDFYKDKAKGYQYMYGAYYTAIPKPTYDTPVRYATFEKLADDETKGTTADYITITYNQPTGEKDADGNDITTPVLVNYKIDSISESQEAGKSYNDINEIDSSDEYIYVNLYPSTFTNLYESVLPNVQDGSYYTATDDAGIGHKVKYFLYVGGFIVESSEAENKIYIPVTNLDSQITVYQYGEVPGIDIIPGVGTSTQVLQPVTIKVGDLKGNLDKYHIQDVGDFNENGKTDDYVTIEEAKLYIYSEGQLYQYSAKYALNDDGLLCRLREYYDSVEENGMNYNYNLYCSSLKHQFYTRYMYDKDGLEFNDAWGKDGIGGAYKLLIDGSGSPNGNLVTRFVEVVKVTLCGGVVVTSAGDSIPQTAEAGNFTVN